MLLVNFITLYLKPAYTLCTLILNGFILNVIYIISQVCPIIYKWWQTHEYNTIPHHRQTIKWRCSWRKMEETWETRWASKSPKAAERKLLSPPTRRIPWSEVAMAINTGVIINHARSKSKIQKTDTYTYEHTPRNPLTHWHLHSRLFNQEYT